MRTDLLEVIALKQQLSAVTVRAREGIGARGSKGRFSSKACATAPAPLTMCLRHSISRPPRDGSQGETASMVAVGAGTATSSDLRSYSIGDKCQALFESDGKWYNSKVVALAEDGYFVTYLGYGNTAQVDVNEVRPYVRPDTTEWRQGADVLAIAPSDGKASRQISSPRKRPWTPRVACTHNSTHYSSLIATHH